jgi:hypothetical protein
MTRWRVYLAAALLLMAAKPSQDARGSAVLPRSYVFLFVYEKVELDDDHRDLALYNLKPKIAKSVSGVDVSPGQQLSNSERDHVIQSGGEVLEIKLETKGDDRYMKLEVISHLHPSKPYLVMTVKTKETAVEMLSFSANLEKIAEIVHQHHLRCHVEGACP